MPDGTARAAPEGLRKPMTDDAAESGSTSYLEPPVHIHCPFQFEDFRLHLKQPPRPSAQNTSPS
eukprot:scaffold649226_cov39-Prasinocladus_malaysianus.AAC.1